MRIGFTRETTFTKANGKLLVAGMAVAIAIPLTACAGGNSPASPANGGGQQPAAATAGGAPVSTLSGDAADVQACTNLKQAATAFLANKNQDNLDAFAVALAARPGAAMSPSLDSAFSALSDDVQNEMLGDSAAVSGQSDQNAVAEGCASAGVPMPAGFTG
jgi:hypothetical protein